MLGQGTGETIFYNYLQCGKDKQLVFALMLQGSLNKIHEEEDFT